MTKKEILVFNFKYDSLPFSYEVDYRTYTAFLHLHYGNDIEDKERVLRQVEEYEHRLKVEDEEIIAQGSEE